MKGVFQACYVNKSLGFSLINSDMLENVSNLTWYCVIYVFKKYNIRQAQVSFVGHIPLYFLNLLRADSKWSTAAIGPGSRSFDTPELEEDQERRRRTTTHTKQS